jgi:hypothetical protein
MWRFACWLCLLPLAGACRRSDDTPAPAAAPGAGWRVASLEAPTSRGSGEPNLASAPDGRVFLSWIESADDSAALRFASRRAGEEWSASRTVVHGPGFFVNWADFPSLLPLPGDVLVAHWLTRSGDGGHGYDVRLSVSRDGGSSWSPPVVPHRDATSTEHGFVSLLPWPGGLASVVWLDGRATLGRPASEAETQLFHATLDGDGRAGPEAALDARVCDCCQTGAAATDRAAVVAYRDRSPGEVRDISVLLQNEAGWSEPRTLHADGWEMNGCPVNGPAVAGSGARFAVAWFTAAREPEVRVAFSDDAGRSFGAPVRIDDGRPVGRVDVALLPGGDALVSWIEQTQDGAELRVRQSGESGPRRPSLMVADSSSARSSGFPRLELAGAEPVLAWRAVGEPGRVATARLQAE